MTENQNYEMFEEVVHNFGKSGGDIILVKNCLFPLNRCKHGFIFKFRPKIHGLYLREVIIQERVYNGASPAYFRQAFTGSRLFVVECMQ